MVVGLCPVTRIASWPDQPRGVVSIPATSVQGTVCVVQNRRILIAVGFTYRPMRGARSASPVRAQAGT